MMAMTALPDRLTATCVMPSASDCVSTLPWSGWMNCGSSDTYITAILGFSRLVTRPMVNSVRGLLLGSSRTWNGERPPGRIACHAMYSRYSAPPIRSAS
ncbi:hypothetical protein G6F50_017780 [Rhizopus delemar]|uniref:Uncharacterized protein n=1 Tax=Rhizopus delemar TaxID=936053 RepID=A0A9P7BZA7_9FUNG|nr:hypothetical protein G6F50_017780 [Rhizopus delemar]